MTMDRKKVLVVVLLIVAIALSTVSVIVNIGLDNYIVPLNGDSVSPNGNIGVTVNEVVEEFGGNDETR